jgi:uncharacterized protein (TIGR04222 family)
MAPMAAETGWGMTDPVFGTGYLIVCVLFLAAVSALRIVGRRGGPPPGEPHHYEAAYLAGGPRRAVAAALMALRLDALLRVRGKGRASAVGEAPPLDSPLEQAVFEAIRSREATHAAALEGHPGVREEIEALRDGLSRRGLVPGARARLLHRLAGWAFWVLAVVGTLRVIMEVTNGRASLATLVTLATVAGTVIVFRRLRGKGDLTRTGEQALRDLRERFGHLDPGNEPSWRTYGAPAVAMGVALYGPAALKSIDARFAFNMGLGRFLDPPKMLRPSGVAGVTGGTPVCSGCSSGDGGGGSGCGGGGGGGCGGGGGGN